MKIIASKIFHLLVYLFPFYIQAQFYESASYKNKEDNLPYRFLLPENYTSEKKYPLLVFLHGAGERGIDNKLQLFHGSNLFLEKEFREQYPAIVVFPQCPLESYWATIIDRPEPMKFEYSKDPKDNAILDLVEGMINDLVKKYGVDEKRIYIGGLSMGGMGTFEMVYRNPRMFAAAFAVCGGANPKISKKIRQPAWRIDHGDKDNVVPIIHSKLMYEAMKKEKIDVIFKIHKGVNHNSWDNLFSDPDFIPWLFTQSK
ncbi:MAG: prolyl oligopeptidase family serine peptidase [Bacteroidota bacterium]|nr:prolyl oligopeptidase family serine peptidase [Bacteroidota bacterium]